MKTILRITLLINCLMIFVSNAEAIVQHHTKKELTTVKTEKESFKQRSQNFIKKRFTNKFKKQIKSIKQNWTAAKDKKKKFGKIGSITAFVLLSTAAFTVLKLTNVIAWSWFWVLSPLIFYVSLILLIAIIGIAVVVALKKAND
jgi:Flp pilus assembly protein TadB